MIVKVDKFVPLKGKDEITIYLTANKSDMSEVIKLMTSEKVRLTAEPDCNIMPSQAVLLNNINILLDDIKEEIKSFKEESKND